MLVTLRGHRLKEVAPITSLGMKELIKQCKMKFMHLPWNFVDHQSVFVGSNTIMRNTNEYFCAILFLYLESNKYTQSNFGWDITSNLIKKLAVKVTRLVTNKTIGSKPFIGRDMLLQLDKQVKYMYWYERAHKPLPAWVIFSWLLTVLHRTLLPQGSQFCDFFQVEF